MRAACGYCGPALQPVREEEVSMPVASPGAARIPPSPGQEPAVRRPGGCACGASEQGKGHKKWAHPQVDPFGGVFALRTDGDQIRPSVLRAFSNRAATSCQLAMFQKALT